METVKELTVFLENHPGTLSRLTAALGERDINILGFNLSNSLDHGALRLVVDDPTAAIHLLGEHNMFVIESDILQIGLRHEIGALTQLANALSAASVNVEYAYGSAGPKVGAPTTLYLRVSDTEKAAEVLRGVDEVA